MVQPCIPAGTRAGKPNCLRTADLYPLVVLELLCCIILCNRPRAHDPPKPISLSQKATDGLAIGNPRSMTGNSTGSANLFESSFNKLKQWRRIATRYDRSSLYFCSTAADLPFSHNLIQTGLKRTPEPYRVFQHPRPGPIRFGNGTLA